MKSQSFIIFLLLSLSFACTESRDIAEPMRPDAGAMNTGGSEGDAGENQPCDAILVYRHEGDRLPSRVYLAGNFEVTPWAAGIEMDGPNDAGEYVSRLALLPGVYEYKFVVDGVWINDPENENLADDDVGNVNSVLTHQCPFSPECIRNAECQGQLVCRDFRCKPCECENGRTCDLVTKRCVDTRRCFDNVDCLDGEVCRGMECAQCVEDDECGEGDRCLKNGCGEPLCEDDTACDLENQRCQRYLCEPKPCEAQNFFLADPNLNFERVQLAGSFTNWAAGAIDMFRLDDSRWWVSNNLQNGVFEYKFIVTYRDGTVEWIRDESALSFVNDGQGGQNSQLEVSCVGGSSEQCGSPDVFDWRDAVMYFAMIDRFHDSDGMRIVVDGATDRDARVGPSGQFHGGDLRGLTAKLDYLTDLGVSAIWLSAPYKNRDLRGASMNPCSPDGNPPGCDPNYYSAYHGYWPSPENVDFSNPDMPIPTPVVEPRLGEAADLHELVERAHENGVKVLFDYVMNHIDVESPLFEAHPEWFATRDDGSFFRCGDVAPDNGQQGWNHPYWGTRCVFTDYLPAFDFENSAARAWSIADAIWWAKTFNIDGFRLDAIKHVSQTWLTDLRRALTETFPEPEGGRFYLVGETFDYFDKALLKAFVDVEEKLDGQFDFPLKKRLCEGVFRGDMTTLQRFMDEENRGYYGDRALMTTWIGNHDIPRAIHYASGEIQNCTEGSNQDNGWNWRPSQPQDASAYEKLGLAFGVLFTTEGIPLIYYGDEIGLAGGGDPDNRRLMPWNDDELLPAQLNLRSQIRRLAQIRAEYKSLSRGTRQTMSVNADYWIYRTSCQDARFEDLTVVINRGDGILESPSVPSGTYVDLISETMMTTPISVPPRSMLILKRVQE